MKFKKKPIPVKAEQFSQRNHLWPEGVEVKWVNKKKGIGKFFIKTLEGKHEVSEGDWIITGIKGEKYSIKSDIFYETYEEYFEPDPFPPKFRGSRVIQVIETITCEGRGITGDPCREVKRYLTLDGELLAIRDCFKDSQNE